jgi:hypothetical protein
MMSLDVRRTLQIGDGARQLDATQPLASLKTLRSAVKGTGAHAQLLHGQGHLT